MADNIRVLDCRVDELAVNLNAIAEHFAPAVWNFTCFLSRAEDTSWKWPYVHFERLTMHLEYWVWQVRSNGDIFCRNIHVVA